MPGRNTFSTGICPIVENAGHVSLLPRRARPTDVSHTRTPTLFRSILQDHSKLQKIN